MRVVDYERFTYRSFVQSTKDRDRVKTKGNEIYSDSETNSYSFTKTESLSEAYDLAKNGWDSGIRELDISMDLQVKGTTNVSHSITGGSVDVGRYLSGRPDCMMSFEDLVERDKPRLRIVVPLSYNSGVESETALEYAKKVLNVYQKARQKFNIALVGVFGVKYNEYNTNQITEIEIKSYEQDVVLNNLAFAFHPSFFRRIWFRFAETKDYNTPGYGKAMSNSEIKNQCKGTIDRSIGERAWLIPSLQTSGLSWVSKDVQEI